MAKVGRNDLCPCGSGKKYKKCHGQSNVLEFPVKRVEKEVDRYFLQFQDFMYDHYPDLFPHTKPTSEEEEVEEFIRLLYKGIFEIQEDDATIYQQFIDEEESTILSSSTLKTLKSWNFAKASIYKMIEQNEQRFIQVEDLLFGGTFKVDRERIPLENEDFKVAHYLTGILLNWGAYYKFVPMAVPVESEAYAKHRKKLDNEFSNQSQYDLLSDYFHATFLNHLPLWIYGIKEEEYEAAAPENKVINILEAKTDAHVLETVRYHRLRQMWNMYCEQESPIIRKPAVFAAALEYVYKKSSYFDGVHPVSLKEVAEKYEVGTSSMSKRQKELKNFFFNNEDRLS
ncbi:YecA family protein [Halobacillus seohaensis]|uniref:YecA family protein n=1 Tax=Halobacillus seohaensis TaxID=447421 RepID=A0ABW2ENQ5_9BACI